MIHAYLFITSQYKNMDRDGHGKEFCDIMNRINKQAKTNITIYHKFFDEYNLYLFIYLDFINIGGNVMDHVLKDHRIMV